MEKRKELFTVHQNSKIPIGIKLKKKKKTQKKKTALQAPQIVPI